MIRVKKSDKAPESLLTCNSYNGQDVQRQLIEDQNGKCYICERKTFTDYNIEHLQSRNAHPELTKDWSNLFLSCCYCNNKKSDKFDTAYSPADNNVEDDIRQEYDFASQKFSFAKSSEVGHKEGIDTTIELLDRVFNGSDSALGRNAREEQLHSHFQQNMITFARMLLLYRTQKSSEMRNVVVSELSEKSEYLAFKYQLLKRLSLLDEFQQETLWNRR